MKKNNVCKFKVIPIDPKNEVLDGHLCSKCKNLLIIPFLCEYLCSKKCLSCLDNGRKDCEDCEGQFEKNEKLEKMINKRYKVSCNLCLEEMMPNQFNQHLQEKACKIEKKTKIQERNESSEKIEIQKNNESTRGEEVLVSCGTEMFGKKCEFKGKKSRMLYHQIECEMVDDLKLIEFPLYSRLIYFLVGVGEYQDKKNNLEAPPNDVDEIKMCLEKIGFEKNEKNLLLNQNACKSDLENHLNRLKEEMEGSNKDEKKLNSHSMLFFYFSGHGMKDEEKEIYEICPHDYQIKSRKNGINLQFLVETLFEINCMHVLIVLDSCFGGGIFR